MGGFSHRNNQGWGDGEGAEGQQPQQQGQGQPNQPQANGNGSYNPGDRPNGRSEEGVNEAEPGLGGVAFLQNGRGAPSTGPDPAAEDQPEVPEYSPARRG